MEQNTHTDTHKIPHESDRGPSHHQFHAHMIWSDDDGSS